MLRKGGGHPDDSAITDEVLEVERAFLTVGKLR